MIKTAEFIELGLNGGLTGRYRKLVAELSLGLELIKSTLQLSVK